MNGVGPAEESPRSESRWKTLAQAFAANKLRSENLPLVQRLVDSIGVDHYEGIPSQSYIKGVRRGAGPALKIAFGYTGGLSAAEILSSVGDVDRGSSENGREWWIHHPVNKLRDGNGPAERSVGRDYGVCPIHHLALPASGVCDECGT